MLQLFLCWDLEYCVWFKLNLKEVVFTLPVIVNLMTLLMAGYREGFLWKRGRDNGQYLSRKFILTEREGVLKYFNKHDVSALFMFISLQISLLVWEKWSYPVYFDCLKRLD